MDEQELKREEQNKRKGVITSVIIHAILLGFFLFPLFSYQDPPPELEGVLVSFGEPNTGSGNDMPSTQNVQEVQQAEQAEEVEQAETAEPQVRETEKQTEVKKEEKKLTSDDAEAIAIQKQKQKEAEAIAKRQAEAEAARKKAAAEEARKKQEYQDAKKQFGNIFGEGKGQTDQAGNQGDPSGDPSSNVLEGISTGSGVVGGGLGSRGVTHVPKITDRSQKSGRVVVNVCVDQNGKVISAQYTQRGSTTTDSELRSIAERNARLFQFTESNNQKQCGTITINFQLE